MFQDLGDGVDFQFQQWFGQEQVEVDDVEVDCVVQLEVGDVMDVVQVYGVDGGGVVEDGGGYGFQVEVGVEVVVGYQVVVVGFGVVYVVLVQCDYVCGVDQNDEYVEGYIRFFKFFIVIVVFGEVLEVWDVGVLLCVYFILGGGYCWCFLCVVCVYLVWFLWVIDVRWFWEQVQQCQVEQGGQVEGDWQVEVDVVGQFVEWIDELFWQVDEGQVGCCVGNLGIYFVLVLVVFELVGVVVLVVGEYLQVVWVVEVVMGQQVDQYDYYLWGGVGDDQYGEGRDVLYQVEGEVVDEDEVD